MRKSEIIGRLERIFGEGSGHEIENVLTKEKVVERITEMSKAEEQFEEWKKDEKRDEAEAKRGRKTECFLEKE